MITDVKNKYYEYEYIQSNDKSIKLKVIENLKSNFIRVISF